MTGDDSAESHIAFLEVDGGSELLPFKQALLIDTSLFWSYIMRLEPPVIRL